MRIMALMMNKGCYRISRVVLGKNGQGIAKKPITDIMEDAW